MSAGSKRLTFAEFCARLLGDDGAEFEAPDGRNLDDVAKSLGAFRRIGTRRWEFPDGTAIVYNDAFWDFGFPAPAECECMPVGTSSAHATGCPEIAPQGPAPIPCVMHLDASGHIVQVTLAEGAPLDDLPLRDVMGNTLVKANVVPDVPMPPHLVRWREEIAQRWAPGITPPEQIFQMFAYIDQLRGV